MEASRRSFIQKSPIGSRMHRQPLRANPFLPRPMAPRSKTGDKISARLSARADRKLNGADAAPERAGEQEAVRSKPSRFFRRKSRGRRTIGADYFVPAREEQRPNQRTGCRLNGNKVSPAARLAISYDSTGIDITASAECKKYEE